MTHLAGTTLKTMIAFPKDPADCWIWIGRHDVNGYPKRTLDGTETTGQRWMWQTMFGPLPAALMVFTTCGNRSCVSPYHLRASTRAEVNRNGAGAVLTPGDVREIKRAKYDRGPNTANLLAARYGCSDDTIRSIWLGNSWGKPRKRSPRNTTAAPRSTAQGIACFSAI